MNFTESMEPTSAGWARIICLLFECEMLSEWQLLAGVVVPTTSQRQISPEAREDLTEQTWGLKHTLLLRDRPVAVFSCGYPPFRQLRVVRSRNRLLKGQFNNSSPLLQPLRRKLYVLICLISSCKISAQSSTKSLNKNGKIHSTIWSQHTSEQLSTISNH